MSSDNLTLFGQVVLTAAASAAVNGVSHPLGTIETCMQMRQAIQVRGLYRGFNAVCGVEAASFAIAYITNDVFKSNFGPYGAIVAAACTSAPVIGIGEGAMKNRQANNLAYVDRELWRRSIRPNGLLATGVRELFWNLGIFSLTPKVKHEIEVAFPACPSLAAQALAATVTGGCIGSITTPIAGVKTLIQASEEELSLVEAFKKLTFAPETGDHKLHRAFRGGISRSGYLGVSMCIMNIVYQNLPQLLPAGLKRD
jgi:hypothetical protein